MDLRESKGGQGEWREGKLWSACIVWENRKENNSHYSLAVFHAASQIHASNEASLISSSMQTACKSKTALILPHQSILYTASCDLALVFYCYQQIGVLFLPKSLTLLFSPPRRPFPSHLNGSLPPFLQVSFQTQPSQTFPLITLRTSRIIFPYHALFVFMTPITYAIHMLVICLPFCNTELTLHILFDIDTSRYT